MPKKHHQSFSKPASTYVHPSLGGSKPQAQATTPPTRTVNERLSQLRHEENAKNGPEKVRDSILDQLSQRSVPPHLRHILNLPETAPPQPKPGVRVRRRGPPGPAPPKSWLESSIHAPAHTRPQAEKRRATAAGPLQNTRWRPRGFSTLCALDNGSQSLPRPRSLVHQTLKTIARNWDFLVEYEQHYLATLPVSLKSSLLSYLSVYGPEEGINISSLKVLFLTELELSGATGSTELMSLDLSGLIGPKLALHELLKYFKSPATEAAAHQPEKGPLQTSTSTDGAGYGMERTKPAYDMIDSWEEELEAETQAVTVSRAIHMTRFPNLTRLSLSHPTSASWNHLLSLSAQLGPLTHLSLAYWPTPSRTPNSLTTSIVSKHRSPISMGATSFYSAMDNDWAEAAHILRCLSSNTYCLQWLDLEGCDWLPALSWASCTEPWSRTDVSKVSGREDSWSASDAPLGIDWNGSWRDLTFVNVSQGWIPRNVRAIRSMPSGLIGCELLSWLREHDAEYGEDGLHSEEATVAEVNGWLEKEKEARAVASRVKAARRARGVFCHFDHGWIPPVKGKKAPESEDGLLLHRIH
ncbi:hypothetical protein H2201_003608 [Coniosporium apollinis]|uniref:Tafazzin n=1 Tax=Coniosporium apollinis TaxID=61459 RepID=A0ABQ9NXX9_9PEZI|nr:hypothetical protein H2201_003608 [Coniosporium apollinis]